MKQNKVLNGGQSRWKCNMESYFKIIASRQIREASFLFLPMLPYQGSNFLTFLTTPKSPYKLSRNINLEKHHIKYIANIDAIDKNPYIMWQIEGKGSFWELRIIGTMIHCQTKFSHYYDNDLSWLHFFYFFLTLQTTNS